MSNNMPVPTGQPRGVISPYASVSNFEVAQNMAKQLAASKIIPDSYQNNPANCMVALEMASRMQASPLAVMQNCDVIQGRPNFRSTFMIAIINSSHKFNTDLRFDITGEGDARTCVAWVIDVTNKRLEGPPISIGTAKKEGWYGRKGSKWPTLPDLMLRYRSAAFFARLYAADLVLGMHTTDEAEDIESIETTATHVDQTPVVSVEQEAYQAQPTVHVDVQPPAGEEGQSWLWPGKVYQGEIISVERQTTKDGKKDFSVLNLILDGQDMPTKFFAYTRPASAEGD